MTHVSGRRHNQTATAAIAANALAFTHVGSGVRNSTQPLPAIASDAIHFARRGTLPRSRHRRRGGPRRGWSNSQISSAGHPWPAAHAATSTKGTVGSNGRTRPTSPSSSDASAIERQISLITVGGMSLPFWPGAHVPAPLRVNSRLHPAWSSRCRERRVQDTGITTRTSRRGAGPDTSGGGFFEVAEVRVRPQRATEGRPSRSGRAPSSIRRPERP